MFQGLYGSASFVSQPACQNAHGGAPQNICGPVGVEIHSRDRAMTTASASCGLFAVFSAATDARAARRKGGRQWGRDRAGADGEGPHPSDERLESKVAEQEIQNQPRFSEL